MIGRIRGILVAKNPPEIQLDVNGITYEVQVPMSTLYKLPDIGEELVLHTHFVVREDAQLLYGFFEVKDKTMFRSLIKEKNYQKGYMGLAYEIVINSDPCIAYLMEENTLTMQALVIAHACYGHNSFFKGNYLVGEY